MKASFLPLRTSPKSVCQCLNCGKFIHRECASFSHAHRYCRRHENLVSKCSHSEPSTNNLLFPPPKSVQGPKIEPKKRTTFTLATLIEELDGSKVGPSSAARALLKQGTSHKQQQLQLASKFAKRFAPVLAAGGVVGAIAMGPAAGVLAGLNLFVASIGAETVMAGIGLTASAAAAATVTHQSKVKAAQRNREKLRKGEWAMEICWNCKKNFTGALSDEACRKDAEFLRRFQSSKNRRESFEEDVDERGTISEVKPVETIPDDAEVYRFLFGMFASPGELLGQMNVQLCEAFRKRCTDRHRKQLRRPSWPGRSSSSDSLVARNLAKDTLQDTKMYVAHMLGATLQCFPSLASTPESFRSCTLAVERIIYGDIYAMVFGEFQRTFQSAEAAFAENLALIRREQRYHSSALLEPQEDNSGSFLPEPKLAEELEKAEAKLYTMMQETSSPLVKLILLCEAFRSICCFAENLHQSTSNTDMLIPILCAFFVECPRICGTGSDFVAEIAFISFFTSGGGKGVEGYVLTTLQAAIQVIAAVDLPNGHAKELELFLNDDESEAINEVHDDDNSEFYDAVQ